MRFGTDIAREAGNAVQGSGGFLRCETCGCERPLGDTGDKVSNGWPKHCGYTMRWWTQSQIDAGDVPALIASQ